jgi:hypothetical protein
MIAFPLECNSVLCLSYEAAWNIVRNLLYICGLFNDAVSSSDYIASRDGIINE